MAVPHSGARKIRGQRERRCCRGLLLEGVLDLFARLLEVGCALLSRALSPSIGSLVASPCLPFALPAASFFLFLNLSASPIGHLPVLEAGSDRRDRYPHVGCHNRKGAPGRPAAAIQVARCHSVPGSTLGCSATRWCPPAGYWRHRGLGWVAGFNSAATGSAESLRWPLAGYAGMSQRSAGTVVVNDLAGDVGEFQV